MNLIIFGPPGAGKGTQAVLIVKKFDLFQLSTGDLLRNEINNKTELGKKIDKIISDGGFATDEIVNTLLKNFITDPFYGTNEDSVQWIAENDWIYQSKFSVLEKTLIQNTETHITANIKTKNTKKHIIAKTNE